VPCSHEILAKRCIKMKDKLKKYGLLEESVQELDIPKEAFINFLTKRTGSSEEIKMFEKPNYLYFGRINESSFEITENQKPFGNTSSAKIKGEIKSTKNGIELRLESLLLAQREYIFFGVGIFMFIGGIIKFLINLSSDIETIMIAPVGLSLVGFTYLYMRKDARLAIENFEKRILELNKRHHNKV
jgi:hypothetical protein